MTPIKMECFIIRIISVTNKCMGTERIVMGKCPINDRSIVLYLIFYNIIPLIFVVFSTKICRIKTITKINL